KKLIIFDLDGTLTESKSDMDAEMSRLLCALLAKKPVAVIGGGKYELFQRQLLKKLRCPGSRLRRLYLFPTTSTAFYRYGTRGWRRVYVHTLSRGTRLRISSAFRKVLRELDYVSPAKLYGNVIEDRGTQVTFSALGQDIVRVLGERGVRLKKEWKRKNTALKMKIARRVQRELPDLEVRAAGYTSIDVTQKGIDKAYGIRQIRTHLNVPVRDMLFVGDALEPGGNDYAARRTGVRCIPVSGPRATKKLIRSLLRD
ncbi:MAG: HAD-IIB family hydrolase, partial [Candidatus Liptonbacteria bacterium]|nr:HAD-IIB family hydrolase [Candidatus Liptonbacteria bacterium]